MAQPDKDQPQEKAAEEKAPPPSTSPRLAQETRPDVPSAASEQKADTSAWPDDYKRYMDRFAAHTGKRMTRFGSRYEIMGPCESGGVYVTKIEDAQPKNVMWMSEPVADEYIDQEPSA